METSPLTTSDLLRGTSLATIPTDAVTDSFQRTTLTEVVQTASTSTDSTSNAPVTTNPSQSTEKLMMIEDLALLMTQISKDFKWSLRGQEEHVNRNTQVISWNTAAIQQQATQICNVTTDLHRQVASGKEQLTTTMRVLEKRTSRQENAIQTLMETQQLTGVPTCATTCATLHLVSDNNGCDSVAEKPKTLSEAAREYEEARSFKRKYDQVTVVTGEEDEVNVMQMNCKLFAFDKASGSWLERGRGTLRLNDKESTGDVQSRVVMRTMGSLRVVLNTKIWAGMSVDRLSPKSVRLTAMDASGQVKVFLVTSTPKEAEQLHKSLETRVANQCSRQATQAIQATQATQVATVTGDLTSTSLPPEATTKQRKLSGLEDSGGGTTEKV